MSKFTILAALCTFILTTNSAHCVNAEHEEIMNTENAMAIEDQNLIREYIVNNSGVGVAVGFIDKGKISFFVSGRKTIGVDDHITHDTIFEIGSITKVFTTLLLADSIAKGEIQLDDPIEMFLPHIKVPEKDGVKITLRHLATHLSGLPAIPDNLNPQNPHNPYADYTVDDLYAYLNSYNLQRCPGIQFEYSNTGMGLLGHILVLNAGEDFETLVHNVVCKDLGMTNTGIAISAEMAPHFASGHHQGQVMDHWDIPTLPGAGALRSNIKDMTKFLALNMGLLDSRLTSLAAQCHQSQHTAAFDIGLGWLISRKNDTTIIWHNGGTYGFKSYLGFNPKLERGVVVLTNTSDGWPDELGVRLLDPNFQKTLVNENLAQNSEYMNRFQGNFEVTQVQDQSKLCLEISVLDTRLQCTFSNGQIGKLYPVEYGVFGIEGFPLGKVHFIFEDEIIVNAQLIISDEVVIWNAVPTERIQ